MLLEIGLIFRRILRILSFALFRSFIWYLNTEWSSLFDSLFSSNKNLLKSNVSHELLDLFQISNQKFEMHFFPGSWIIDFLNRKWMGRPCVSQIRINNLFRMLFLVIVEKMIRQSGHNISEILFHYTKYMVEFNVREKPFTLGQLMAQSKIWYCSKKEKIFSSILIFYY